MLPAAACLHALERRLATRLCSAPDRRTTWLRGQRRATATMAAAAKPQPASSSAAAAAAPAAAPAVGIPGTELKACHGNFVTPETYEDQLQIKVEQLRAMLADLAPPEPEVFRSEPSHYRMRAEFRVWHQGSKWKEGEDSYYVMFEKPPPGTVGGKPKEYRVDEYPVGSRLINRLMAEVRAEFLASEPLGARLFQVNFHTTLSGQAMVTMLYHKKLADVWLEAARGMRARLRQALGAECSALHIIGRARGQRLDLDANTVVERLSVHGREYQYKQVEGSFSQPNAGVCQHMLEWAVDVSRCAAAANSDLLELYCGNGNFTLPLAQNFRRVVATEVAKPSVDAARDNMAANGIDNIFIARMSSEEFTAAWRHKAAKRRLEGLDWEALDLQTIFVDPPRAGLDPDTLELLATFQRVIYISCNPETLAANLRAVSGSHRVVRLAAFDQFPYTHHLECGVYLERRPGVQQPAAAGEASSRQGGGQPAAKTEISVEAEAAGNAAAGSEAGLVAAAASSNAAADGAAASSHAAAQRSLQ